MNKWEQLKAEIRTRIEEIGDPFDIGLCAYENVIEKMEQHEREELRHENMVGDMCNIKQAFMNLENGNENSGISQQFTDVMWVNDIRFYLYRYLEARDRMIE